MLFAVKNIKVVGEEPKISIENWDVEHVYETKFLGVVIDCKLNWCYHIYYIANRIFKNIGDIVKVKTSWIWRRQRIYIILSYIHIWITLVVLHVLLICQSCIQFRNILQGRFWVSKNTIFCMDYSKN